MDPLTTGAVGPLGERFVSPPSAYYMAQPQDLRLPDGPPWTNAQLIVANRDMDPNLIRIHAPRAVILAYLSPHLVHDGRFMGGLHGWEFSQYDLKTDFYLDGTGEPRYGWSNTMWSLRWSETHVQTVKLALIVKILSTPGWSGIYVDDFHAKLPDDRIDKMDPSADDRTRTWMRHAWRGWLHKLVEFMRMSFTFQPLSFTFQPSLIVVNAGYDASDTFVDRMRPNGICSEEFWPERRAEFLDSVIRLYPRGLCVAWEWDAQGVCLNGEIRYRREP